MLTASKIMGHTHIKSHIHTHKHTTLALSLKHCQTLTKHSFNILSAMSHTHTHTHTGSGHIKWAWCEGWTTSRHNCAFRGLGSLNIFTEMLIPTPAGVCVCVYVYVCVCVWFDVCMATGANWGTVLLVDRQGYWTLRSRWSVLMRCCFDLLNRSFTHTHTHVVIFKDTRGKHKLVSMCIWVGASMIKTQSFIFLVSERKRVLGKTTRIQNSPLSKRVN